MCHMFISSHFIISMIFFFYTTIRVQLFCYLDPVQVAALNLQMKYLLSINNSVILQVCFTAWLEWEKCFFLLLPGFVINLGHVWWCKYVEGFCLNPLYIAHCQSEKTLFMLWHQNSDCRLISNHFGLAMRA